MRGVIRGGDGYNGTGVRLRNVYGIRQDIKGKQVPLKIQQIIGSLL